MDIEFASTMFGSLPGEEEKTNPGIFGQALAEWVAQRLREEGTPVSEVIPEDWGWCVIVSKHPFRLWIGCGNMDGETSRWRCFVHLDLNLFQRLFKKNGPALARERLHQSLLSILRGDSGISGIEETDV